jgi:predicted deacylase
VAEARRPDIVVGGNRVRAGSRALIELRIAELSTHTPIELPVQVLHGRREGARLFVCAALHGDEINGVEIIRRVLKLSALRRLRGTLIAVPIVNVPGFIVESRYLPDRRDLNRSFPGSTHGSLAARLANLFLNEIVSHCTHGIDLHTAAIHRDNFPQIRANIDDEESARMARAFGVPVVVNADYRAGSLREAAARRGVPVIVYEAGEALRFDEMAIRAGVTGVVRVMRALGMLRAAKPARRRSVEPLLARSSHWVRAPISGILRASVSLGARITDGERLGVIADPFGENEAQVVAPKGGLVIGRTNLPLVHEGAALFNIVRFEGTKVAARTLDAFEQEAGWDSEIAPDLEPEPPIV